MNKPTSFPLPDHNYRKAHREGGELCIGGAQPCDVQPRGLQVSMRIAHFAFLTGLMNAKANTLLVVCHRVNLSKPVTLRATDSGVQNAWRSFETITPAGKRSETDYLEDSVSGACGGCGAHHTASYKLPHRNKKGLRPDGIPFYGYNAPAKSGAGIGVLLKLSATHDAPSVFFVSLAQYTLFSAVRCHSVLASELWWAGRGLLRKRRFPITPVTPTLSSPSPVKLAFPVMGLIPCYRRLPPWLLPLTKIRNLFGLSPLFAAIARQSQQKSTISFQNQSRKPAAH